VTGQERPAEVKCALFRFQIKDDIKAARIEATKAYSQYVEEPKTSQQRRRFDLELELDGGTEQGAPLAQVVGSMDLIDNPIEVILSQQDGNRFFKANGIHLSHGKKWEFGVHGFRSLLLGC
jgi:hypothetical protein